MRLLPVLLVCPFLTGCLAFGYPSLTQTPPLRVAEPQAKVFRVTTGHKSYGPWMTGPIQLLGSIEEIAVLQGEVPAQYDAHWIYYYLAFPVAEGSYNRHFEIRVYRRGFETRVIEPRSVMTAVLPAPLDLTVGKRADTLEAQEKAIDDVLSGLMFWQNAQASAFLAEEYLALASNAELAGFEHEKTRKRLEEKAKKARAGER